MPREHFCLRLHQLAQAFEAAGGTDDQRSWAIASQLAEMPPEVRQQSLAHAEKLARPLAVLALPQC